MLSPSILLSQGLSISLRPFQLPSLALLLLVLHQGLYKLLRFHFFLEQLPLEFTAQTRVCQQDSCRGSLRRFALMVEGGNRSGYGEKVGMWVWWPRYTCEEFGMGVASDWQLGHGNEHCRGPLF